MRRRLAASTRAPNSLVTSSGRSGLPSAKERAEAARRKAERAAAKAEQGRGRKPTGEAVALLDGRADSQKVAEAYETALAALVTTVDRPARLCGTAGRTLVHEQGEVVEGALGRQPADEDDVTSCRRVEVADGLWVLMTRPTWSSSDRRSGGLRVPRRPRHTMRLARKRFRGF